MSRNIIELVLKLLAASLAVGLVLSFFAIDPWQYLGPAGSIAQGVIGLGTTAFRWAWTYVVLGAAVVVPLWLIYVIYTYLRRQ